MHHPTDRIVHTTAFVTPVVEHWLEREIAQLVHPMKDRSDDPSHHERTLLPQSYISLPNADELSYISGICFSGALVASERMKEIFNIFNDALNTFLFTSIWRRTYGKGQIVREE